MLVVVAQLAMTVILLMSFVQELYVAVVTDGVACVLGAKTASTASKTRELASKKGREI